MIPHSRPSMHGDDTLVVARVLESGMLAAGAEVASFEGAIAEYMGLPRAAAFSSGTAALWAALRALGTGCGDEVVIPAYSCSALWHAVRMTGAEAVPADTGADGIHMDGSTVRAALTPRTKAVVFVHLFGAARDISGIAALGIPVIEDCAQSLGATRNGIMAGALGSAAAVCSFYATKVIAAGEGGMVLSGDRALVERARDMSDGADRIDGVLRFNLKMTDIAAALGRSQLSRIESFITRRRSLAARYREAFGALRIDLPVDEPGERHIRYRFIVRSDRAGDLRSTLIGHGIRAERPVYSPLSRIPGTTGTFPGAERAWERNLSIPLYPSLTDEEADTVVRGMMDACGEPGLVGPAEP